MADKFEWVNGYGETVVSPVVVRFTDQLKRWVVIRYNDEHRVMAETSGTMMLEPRGDDVQLTAEEQRRLIDFVIWDIDGETLEDRAQDIISDMTESEMREYLEQGDAD